jgi:hypothetical protein
MIVWREKFIAFGIHFAATLAVALIAAALFFFVWFPVPFHEMVGGSKLFMLVVACDLVLGPLISLVIYNSRKSRRELYIDYSIVALVQLAALGYGMYTSFNARPVYVVFAQDRLEVITASEIEDADLEAAKLPEYRKRPLWGPQLVAAFVKPEDHNDALEQAISGRDISVRPKFYVPFESQLARIKTKLQPLDELRTKHAEAARLLAARDDSGLAGVKWLPVKHKKGFWTALIDEQSGKVIDYLAIDPY